VFRADPLGCVDCLGKEIVVVHRVGDEIEADAVLTGAWDGGSGVLAGVRVVG
jgi:hypothetical protein